MAAVQSKHSKQIHIYFLVYLFLFADKEARAYCVWPFGINNMTGTLIKRALFFPLCSLQYASISLNAGTPLTASPLGDQINGRHNQCVAVLFH